MLINTLRQDMITARKGSNAVAKSLMVTLYSEASMVGKNKRNGDPTDDEVIAVIKKFKANAEETVTALTNRSQSADVQHQEIGILEKYLPTQLSNEQLVAEITAIIATLEDASPKSMGKVMAELKLRHGSNYDGRAASDTVKMLLNTKG